MTWVKHGLGASLADLEGTGLDQPSQLLARADEVVE
jgi:hypothetical protein